MLQFYEDGPAVNEYWITISGHYLRIYKDRESHLENIYQPLYQIPTKAIESVQKNLRLDTLLLNQEEMEEEEVVDFQQGMFGIKLKEDFMYVYVKETYGELGLSEEEIILANKNELAMDENSQSLVEYFGCLERHILSKIEPEDKDMAIILESEDHIELKMHLSNKLFLFSWNEVAARDEFINILKLIEDHGEQWLDELAQTQNTSQQDKEIDS